MQKIIKSGRHISTLELSILIILVTSITGSSLDELLPAVSRLLRILAYGSIILFSIWHILPSLNHLSEQLRAFYQRYRTFLIAVGLYFLGLIIGGLRGPDPLYSLWQTFSDGMVFVYAFVIFGVADDDKDQIIDRIFRITATWTGLLLLASLIIYVGNLAGWWLINPYYHPDAGRSTMLLNGPFNHANHFAYVLMIGTLASSYLALLKTKSIDWKWLLLTAVLCAGVMLTFGRGSMLGTAAGLLIIITIKNRRIGLILSAAAVLVIAYLVAGALSLISIPSFVPKISFAGRGVLWEAAIDNLRIYGPLGVGSGQAESLPGMDIHNFILEQYGEGGILTTLGVLLWLIIPVWTYAKSVLNKNHKIAIVVIMIGIMIHGLFWSQFLNGLRFLSLIAVLLWCGLATLRQDETENAPDRLIVG